MMRVYPSLSLLPSIATPTMPPESASAWADRVKILQGALRPIGTADFTMILTGDLSWCRSDDGRIDVIEQGAEGQWFVLSETGNLLGEHESEEAAQAQLRAIEQSKGEEDDAEEEAEGGEPDGESEEVTPFDSEGAVRRVDFLEDLHTDPTRSDGLLAQEDPRTGFLHVDGLLTRTGVFTYRDAKGNAWGEVRDADEVFEQESLDSFKSVVVTDDHPAEFVSVANVRDVQVGHVGSDVRRDGKFVRGSITITDADTIQRIKDGKTQLSNGYTATIIPERGVTDDGQEFAGRQTNIRGNHVAIVTKGRAGSACALQLDSAYAEVQPTMKITFNGVEYTDAAALQTVLDALEIKATDAADDAPDNSAELAKLQATVDTLRDDLTAEREGRDDAIDKRAQLVAVAAEVLGADARTNGVGSIAIMRAVAEKIQPQAKDRLEARKDDAAYIQAAYDTALELHQDRKRHNADADLTVFPTVENTDTEGAPTLDALQAAYVSRLQDGYQLTDGEIN